VPTLCHPATRPIRVTEPTFEQEPITLEQARRQCNLGVNDYHDPDLKDWVVSARRTVEHDSGVIGYTGSFTWNLTEFPCEDRIEILGVRPVTAVSSIAYTDTAGTPQTFSSSYYSLKNKSLVPSIVLGYGYVWPAVRGVQEEITITLTAGHASVALMPEDFRDAVKLRVRLRWLVGQGEVAEAEKCEQAYDNLIRKFRREDYA
jgi:uncharacterized phiE125 gp8 family phage protein